MTLDVSKARQLPADPRMLHMKVVAVDAVVVAMLLQMDGSRVMRAEGWPEGAVVVGTKQVVLNTSRGLVSQFQFLLYHPDFPVVLSDSPPVIGIDLNFTPLVQAQADAVAEAVDEADS